MEEYFMVNASDLKELLDYAPQKAVVSLYLNTDPTQGASDHYKLILRAMLKDVNLADDVEIIERYFDHEHDWSGRSVAVFSCAADAYFRAYPIAVPIRSRIRVDKRPYVKPLADLFDSYGGYGVALVDQQGARLFHFHLGALREQEGLLGETVRRTKSGGGSQTGGRRGGVAATGRRGGVAGLTKHSDEVSERNMREAADFAAQFFTENKIRRVLIGGTEDNVAFFRSLLPKSWQSLTMGSFPISMTASHIEVMDKAFDIARKAETQREARLVTSIITAAAKGRGGVIRLDDTLSAVHEGRVQTLAIVDGFRAPGYRCQGCGYLTIQEMDSCSFCGNSFEQIADAVEMAVRKVMQDGGEVEILRENDELEKAGKIGALLRY
jgi:peptide subunit release factor 1 (eRF1)